ncbi:peptidoglycan-recognition protein LA-like isoform X2 [Anopheles bellator]|uniref:peptidoglycan-recognition protein LA-like isoform X2 n=1 Tax=Anopheles bellator TaxID=139047 RepID=UPI0026471828|nr:peptidoglycan-recognition protein LA-like isoform X2 [Anopheles bellator]
MPESVAAALTRIHPRYNNFQQHNSMPAGPQTLGARYEQSANNPGVPVSPQNNMAPSSGGTSGGVQPAATSVINLSNSSDVVIGPMTHYQYQGAVTIYQYMDATVEASRIATGRNNQNRSLPSTVPSTLRQERYFIYGALIFFAIIGFSSAIYVIINQTRTANDLTPSQDINFDRNYDSRTIPTLGNSHMIIDRRNWGSQDDVSASVQLKRPISYVIVTHIGVSSKACTDVYQCSNKLRILQDAAIGERHLPDLPSNFYIGGDGNVYVGRGWRIANSYHNRTLSVCFMGDYNRYDVNDSQISALQHLLTYGVVQNSLATDYKLVGRQQTKNTTSPGSLLYAKIVRLSRWDPCGTQGYSHCGAELGYPAVWDEERLLNKRNGITIHMVGTRKTTEEE